MNLIFFFLFVFEHFVMWVSRVSDAKKLCILFSIRFVNVKDTFYVLWMLGSENLYFDVILSFCLLI